jgi:hypothetical protein
MAYFDDLLGPEDKKLLAAAEKKPGYFDDILGPDETAAEPEGRALSMLANGLTFGLAPRIGAAIETGAISGPEYEEAKKKNWAKDDAYREANPWTSMALEIGGSLPTMFIPGLGAGRVAQAANQARGTVQNLSRGERLARAVGVGRNVGSVGQEAGALGAKTAALYSGLASREDTAEGRIAEGAMAAPFGYAFGRAGDAVGRSLAGVGEQIYDAARVGGNSVGGALTSLRRGMERDGVTTAQIRDAVMPNMGRMNAPQEAVEEALVVYGREIAGGANEAAARRAANAAYTQTAQAQGVQVQPRTAATHVNRALDDYLTRQTEVPLALDETARLAGSRGQNSQWTRRAAANSPGEGREQLFDSVTSRQEDIIPSVRARVVNTMGDEDFLGATTRLRQQNANLEDQLYGIARQNEVPFDLSDVFREYQGTQAFRAGGTRDAVEQALNVMRARPMADGSFQRHTIDTYIQARREMQDLIDASMKVNPATGQETATTTTTHLRDLKRRMDEVVAGSNPRWRLANDITRDLRSVEGALQDAQRVRLSGNDNHSADVIRRVSAMRDEVQTLQRQSRRPNGLSPQEQGRLGLLQNQIEAYRTGFARTLHKELDGLGDTHDVSKKFLKGGRRAQSGVKRTIEVMMGDDAGPFMDMIERAQIAGTTYKQQFNSQTTPLREVIDEEKQNSKIAGMLRALGYVTNPRQMFQDAGEGISNNLFAARNTEIARRLAAMTDQPQDFFQVLREIDTLAAERGRAFNAPGVNLYSAPGVASGAFGTQINVRENAERQPFTGSQQGLTADRLEEEERGAFR